MARLPKLPRLPRLPPPGEWWVRVGGARLSSRLKRSPRDDAGVQDSDGDEQGSPSDRA